MFSRLDGCSSAPCVQKPLASPPDSAHEERSRGQ